MSFLKTFPTSTPVRGPAFANFTPAELWVLSRVPITHVELQYGCDWQCLACGVNAPGANPGKDMTWQRASSIAREGGRIRREMGFSIFHPRCINLNYRGDGVSWRPPDVIPIDRRKGYNGLVHLFHDECDVQTGLTIPGFDATDSFATENILAFAADLHLPEDERAARHLMYSVKLFQRKMAIPDMNRFLAGALEFLFTAPSHEIKSTYAEHYHLAKQVRSQYQQIYEQAPSTFLSRPDAFDLKVRVEKNNFPWLEWFVQRNAEVFFQSSRFVDNLIENLKVLNTYPVIYELQENWFGDNVPLENKRYQPFFKLTFLGSMFKHCIAEAGLDKPITSSPRRFRGMGRATTDLGISPIINNTTMISELVSANASGDAGFLGFSYVPFGEPADVPDDLPEMRNFAIATIGKVHATISTDGRLRFHYSGTDDSLLRACLTRDFLLGCAEGRKERPEQKKTLSLLAGMAERDVFGG